jgi:hypothetical protein
VQRKRNTATNPETLSLRVAIGIEKGQGRIRDISVGPKSQFTTRGRSPAPLSVAAPACAGCCDDLVASRLSRLGPRSGRISTAGTPDDALEVLRDLDQKRLTTEAAAQLLGLERAATAPHRSSNRTVTPDTPGNPPGSVICNWQRGDILIGRLHESDG